MNHCKQISGLLSQHPPPPKKKKNKRNKKKTQTNQTKNKSHFGAVSPQKLIR